MTTKILNQAQAEAFYKSFCLLREIGGEMSMHFKKPKTRHKISISLSSSRVLIGIEDDNFNWLGVKERYINVVAFATAYGLQQD